MTLKQLNILNALDILSILFAITELSIITAIVKYDTNTNMKVFFIVIGIVCFISIIKSIKCIKSKQK